MGNNTYTQIHIQAVFAVQYRAAQIQSEWKDRLYEYITGIIRNNEHKLLVINGMADHIHIFFGMRPSQSLSDLMQDIKGSSSKWINDQKIISNRFAWQEGYGAFSYRKSDVSSIIRYIERQEVHHRHQSFIDEYTSLLDEAEIAYDQRFIFKPLQ